MNVDAVRPLSRASHSSCDEQPHRATLGAEGLDVILTQHEDGSGFLWQH